MTVKKWEKEILLNKTKAEHLVLSRLEKTYKYLDIFYKEGLTYAAIEASSEGMMHKRLGKTEGCSPTDKAANTVRYISAEISERA